MGTHEKKISELVDKVRSWIPRRTGTQVESVSRDFWMPDQSCRVCYDCDSQFTLFNRRHHCRICGRVFCSKCTSNSISVYSTDEHNSKSAAGEEGERIRVCNYCFKQWEQGIVGIDNGLNVYSPALSPSPSATSLASCCTCNSSSSTVGSLPYSTGPYHHVSPTSDLSPPHHMHPTVVEQCGVTSERSRDSTVTDGGKPSPEHFGFCITRSDDDNYDDNYGVDQSDSEGRHFSRVHDYYSTVNFDEMDHVYGQHKMHPDREGTDANSTIGSLSLENFNEGCLEDMTRNHEGDVDKHDKSDVCEAEPLDFENNGLLWLPPEPEDGEDERESALFDDDDGGDASGEWGYLRPSSSFGSGSNRERSSEEHRRAMKNVVDGHFRALVAQLLQVENLPLGVEEEEESWLDIITSLSWEAATLLKPDTSKSGGMDPGGYVKVKCLASGHRSESVVVKGVVCKKNVAHRRMTSYIEKPRFLILGGALEYQRVSNLLSSFDTLLQQEMEHLKMAVAKIESHHPDVLLVEKSVSRFAQDYLLAKDISLVLNIKKPLLERIARCTGAQIVPSIDHLTSQKLGHCETFHVEKFLEEHGSSGQNGKRLMKTLMFFEDCPRPLGCTILLKGASGDALKKVKHVIQYGVFAAYHLALETSFLADEGASLPELPLKSPVTVALPDKPSSIDRSISLIPGFSSPATPAKSQNSQPVVSKGLILANKSFTSVSKLESTYLHGGGGESTEYTYSPAINYYKLEEKNNALDAQTDISDNCEAVVEDKLRLSSCGIHDDHFNGNPMPELAAFERDHNKQQEVGFLKEEFPPSPSDRSILVSLSTRCIWKGTVCERAHLFRIKYYGSFDKPLGRFLRDHLFDQSYRCRACEMPSEAHVHCYTHRQGSLTISVKKMPEFLLPGEREGKIWMWHRCLRCPRCPTNGFPPATRRLVMSDAAWGLSFGKFLELSFSNHAAASRVATCGHSLHRDCLRFYGFARMVACFRYASIDVHSVYLPPPELEFNYDNQEWIQNDANEVGNRAEILFAEVQNAILKISEKISEAGPLDSTVKEQESKHWITQLEETLRNEKQEYEQSLAKALNREAKIGEPVVDILQINRLRKQLLCHSYMWDQRLIYASSFSSNKAPWEFLPKPKEKPLRSTEKPVASNSASQPGKGLSTCDSFLLDARCGTNHIQGATASHVNKPGVGVEEPAQRKEAEVRNLTDRPGSRQSSTNVRRALSEGQFPMKPNLSDTLDAAWIGQSQRQPLKDRDVQADLSIVLRDSLAVNSDVKSCRDNEGVPEVSRSPSPVLAPKGGGPSFDKSSSWRMLKLGRIGEYDPSYVFSFRDLGRQGGARVLLPVGVNDTVIPVLDDEPTSIIAYALASPDYRAQIADEPERSKEGESSFSMPLFDLVNLLSLHSLDETSSDQFRSLGSTDDSILSVSSVSRSFKVLDPLLCPKALHARVSFTDEGPLGKVKYSVTCYFAKRFEALRRTCCPSELDFIRSLSRCKKWGPQGGKSNVFFAKTLDDRFIIKQVTKTELESFIKFAPAYFKYLSETISTRSPTCLAKIQGIYQVTSKHLKGGKETRMDVLVMENLLFRRNITRLYDLKGSSRSRYNPDSSGNNKILLDQNLIEAMPTSPIFVGNKAKRLLERAVWNDTSFLASIDVMDYSLLVGVDEEKHELVLGIIDFMRQYTWDKHLETWVKATGILGGPKNASPTVISPKQYKKRFRKAMSAYFVMVPDQWSAPTLVPSGSYSDLCEENLQGGASC